MIKFSNEKFTLDTYPLYFKWEIKISRLHHVPFNPSDIRFSEPRNRVQAKTWWNSAHQYGETGEFLIYTAATFSEPLLAGAPECRRNFADD